MKGIWLGRTYGFPEVIEEAWLSGVLRLQNAPIHTLQKWLIGSLPPGSFEAPLIEQQATQSAKVVQDTAAGRHVTRKLAQIEMNKLQSLFAPVRPVGSGERNVGLHFGEGLLYRVSEERDILM